MTVHEMPAQPPQQSPEPPAQVAPLEPVQDQPVMIQLPNPDDVPADLGIILSITQQQRNGWMNTAAFWQAAHAQLLAQHNQVVENLTKRIVEAQQGAAADVPDAAATEGGAGDDTA